MNALVSTQEQRAKINSFHSPQMNALVSTQEQKTDSASEQKMKAIPQSQSLAHSSSFNQKTASKLHSYSLSMSHAQVRPLPTASLDIHSSPQSTPLRSNSQGSQFNQAQSPNQIADALEALKRRSNQVTQLVSKFSSIPVNPQKVHTISTTTNYPPQTSALNSKASADTATNSSLSTKPQLSSTESVSAKSEVKLSKKRSPKRHIATCIHTFGNPPFSPIKSKIKRPELPALVCPDIFFYISSFLFFSLIHSVSFLFFCKKKMNKY